MLGLHTPLFALLPFSTLDTRVFIVFFHWHCFLISLKSITVSSALEILMLKEMPGICKGIKSAPKELCWVCFFFLLLCVCVCAVCLCLRSSSCNKISFSFSSKTEGLPNFKRLFYYNPTSKLPKFSPFSDASSPCGASRAGRLSTASNLHKESRDPKLSSRRQENWML